MFPPKWRWFARAHYLVVPVDVLVLECKALYSFFATKSYGTLRGEPPFGVLSGCRKSSRPKLCRLKPELSRPKCWVMSPEFYQVKCTEKQSEFLWNKECVTYLVLKTIIRRNKRNECVTYLVRWAMMRRNRRYIKLMCNISRSLTLDEQRKQAR